ncbi:hypothetical protein GCM10027080_25960 [Pedococcus soli]
MTGAVNFAAGAVTDGEDGWPERLTFGTDATGCGRGGGTVADVVGLSASSGVVVADGLGLEELDDATGPTAAVLLAAVGDVRSPEQPDRRAAVTAPTTRTAGRRRRDISTPPSHAGRPWRCAR